MAQYNTPGVYGEEISVFPGSIAGVATAVPAFIGYVEKAENNGVGIPFNTPVRLTSILDYQAIFGGAEGQDFSISINDDTTQSPVVRTVSLAKNAESKFRLYYNIQMYFANGGGPCYVVPVGLYSSAGVSTSDMLAGLDAIAKVDEPTLLLFPDALSLNVANNKTIYDAALAQCAKLTDRFTIMDVRTTNDPAADAAVFRNTGVGPDNLKYGASYYPYINTTLSYGLNENLVHVNAYTINGNNVAADEPHTITLLNAIEIALDTTQRGLSNARIETSNLSDVTVSTLWAAVNSSIADITAALGLSPAPASAIVTAITTSAPAHPVTMTDVDDYISAGPPAGDFYTANDNYITATPAPTQTDADFLILTYNNLIGYLQAIRSQAYAALATITTPAPYIIGSLTNIKNTLPALYNTISAQISAYTIELNPSGAMAGIYARVDNDRGVWKAPANVGVQMVTGPALNVTNAQQDGLNVDATSGKSINVIRSFTGRGTLVWGARTLAGNDNEWRYINVRRLFIYVEESVAEATEFVVFEPNTANTWQRVKGMIEAFLTGLWRDGGLAGATTKDAFFVNVGLGITMTAQDILEGRMIVEVGMAAVRPAEFIILRFEHKLQES